MICSVPVSLRMASIRSLETDGLNFTNTSLGTKDCGIVSSGLFSAMITGDGVLLVHEVRTMFVPENRSIRVRRGMGPISLIEMIPLNTDPSPQAVAHNITILQRRSPYTYVGNQK